jgi:ABC-type multidrug transport system fused ATPase/permease subunit
MAFALAFILGLGGYSVIHKTLSVGELVAFYSYLTRLFDPLSSAVDLHTRIPQLRVSISRILELLETAPTVGNDRQAVTMDDFAFQRITFRNVTFSYRNRGVLKNFDYEIAPGTKLAIVGPSGTGKSTLAKLLIRLYDVSSGDILIGTRPLKSIQLKSLRSAVSFVPQEPMLFNGTLRENLLLGRIDASREELLEAVRLARLEVLVTRLPRGWDEYLGPHGAMLSGGEKQRVAIAQAILKRPQILILDESTSALDSPIEAAILDMLNLFFRKKTILFVSHRPSVMLWADQVLLMAGHIATAAGTHSELWESSPLYRRIFNEQLEKENAFEIAASPAIVQAIG